MILQSELAIVWILNRGIKIPNAIIGFVANFLKFGIGSAILKGKLSGEECFMKI